jgi:hypothetical protein
MNYLILLAGVFASLATIGHFVIGNKDFLKPVMNSDIDEIPKKVMQSLFHYMSVFMILSAVILVAISMGQKLIFENTSDIVMIIGCIYAGFAIVQFFIALTSSIKLGVLKMFQWVFWTLIAIFSFLGL